MSSASYFRSKGYSNQTRTALQSFLRKKYDLNSSQYDTIVNYLQVRGKEVKGKESFGVVYDLTNYCNLNCAHCAVDATLISSSRQEIEFETSTDESRLILDKIRRYCDSKGYPKAFVMFGGGEPTLRPDLEEVLKHASTLFGVENVGFNSNGINLSKEYMSAFERYVGAIEISIDGLEHYHNKWRDPHGRSRTGNPFKEAVDLISELVKDEHFRDKVEVSSIITKDNLEQLPELVTYLDSIGVRKYSIHRAMPVGRMALHLDKVLDTSGYVRLLLMIAEQKRTLPMKGLHLHHSLESIYSALFLGTDIHLADLPMGSGRHSIGIDPMGNVFFDPWSVVGPYNRFSAGNLLRADADMLNIMDSEDSIIKIADDITKRRTRCKACRMECGGGMRFNAMAHYVSSLPLVGRIDIDEGHFLTGLSQIDPACPLYDERLQ